jgi:hypothetical protein
MLPPPSWLCHALCSWIVSLIVAAICSLMFPLIARMVGGLSSAASRNMVCWTLSLVCCGLSAKGPLGFSLAWFTLHFLCKMLLLLTAGCWLWLVCADCLCVGKSWLVCLGLSLLPEAFLPCWMLFMFRVCRPV